MVFQFRHLVEGLVSAQRVAITRLFAANYLYGTFISPSFPQMTDRNLPRPPLSPRFRTCLYWVLPGFTVLCWHLLGFTGYI